MNMFFNILSMGGVSYETEYQAILDRATTLGYTHPSTAQKTKQNQFVLDLKNAGIWTELDVLYVFATDGNSSFAQLNWITPASYEITQVNTPTFTTNEGFDFNGTTQYLNTNWNPSANGVNFTLNDAGAVIYINENISGSGQDYGASGNADGTSSPALRQNSRNTSDQNARCINDGTPSNYSTATSIGFWQAKRLGTSGNRKYLWLNGSLVQSTTTASTSVPNVNLFIGASNGNGTATSYSTREVSMFCAGSSLDGLEASMYNAWNTYFTSL